MPVLVVDGSRARASVRWLGRLLTRLVAAIMIAAGVAATSVLAVFVVALVATQFGETDPESRVTSQDVQALASSSAIAVVGLFGGIRLMRGKRRLVLFLRKFGFSDATEALTVAITSAIGRQSRLVTLDDAEVRPVGVSRGSRTSVGIARWLGVVVVIGAVVWFATSGIEWFVERASDDGSTQQDGDGLGDVFGDAIVAFFVAIVLIAMFMMGVVVLIGGTVFAWAAHRAVVRAERSKTDLIDESDDVADVVRRIHRQTRRVFSSRLTVVRVADDQWRDVVTEFGRTADIALIDVSEPTESLLWEVHTMREDDDIRLVMIARIDRARDLNDPDRLTDAGRRLADEIDGEIVLGYEPDGRRAQRFERGLRARLESAT